MYSWLILWEKNQPHLTEQNSAINSLQLKLYAADWKVQNIHWWTLSDCWAWLYSQICSKLSCKLQYLQHSTQNPSIALSFLDGGVHPLLASSHLQEYNIVQQAYNLRKRTTYDLVFFRHEGPRCGQRDGHPRANRNPSDWHHRDVHFRPISSFDSTEIPMGYMKASQLS